MKTTELGLAGAGLVLSAFPVVAHHSFAMFDRSHTMTLEGTVREFQWSNPHASIMLAVTREGQSQLWVVEMMGPGGLARQGWTQNTLTPGMRVRLLIHPLREGGKGGQFVGAILSDGKRLGR